jgi:hypothetical protein
LSGHDNPAKCARSAASGGDSKNHGTSLEERHIKQVGSCRTDKAGTLPQDLAKLPKSLRRKSRRVSQGQCSLNKARTSSSAASS